MSCYINNQGNSVAPSSSVGFYLSNDATLDATDQLLTSQYGTQLYTNFPSQRYGTAAVPNNLAPGTYIVVVDPATCKALSGLMFEQRFNVER